MDPLRCAEGIILRVIPFRDHDMIVTLFTREEGVLKLFYSGRGRARVACTPLMAVEVVYRERAGEIFGCQKMTCIHAYHHLRRRLVDLQVATDLLTVLLSSQLLGKSVPQLYALLLFYLEKIPQMADPFLLSASFRLKLLKHEGLIASPFACRVCGQELQERGALLGAEWRCLSHQTSGSILVDDLLWFYRLMDCQSYREIAQEQFPPELRGVVRDFFESCWRD